MYPLVARSLPYLRTARSATIRHPFLARNIGTQSSATHALQFQGANFPFRWLRDSCQCPQCVHPSSRQKLHSTSDIAENISPGHNGVEIQADGVHIRWSNGHNSFYPNDFLHAHGSPTSLRKFHLDTDPITWDAEKLKASSTLFVPYGSLQSKSALLGAFEQLLRYGLLLITGVPNEKTSTADCELRTLATKFGEIRHTFYGELWDVKNVRNSTNIAYTNLDLGYHIDLEYFQHPPKYQFLHCLRNRVKGGTSLFVDALRTAQELRNTHPDEFEVLSTTPVTFHYINDGHHLHNAHPTIELAPVWNDPSTPRPIHHINYSPPFQAPLPLSTPPEFYSALNHFTQLLKRPEYRFDYLLKEGDAVVFDNRRVLHARTSFVDDEREQDESGGVNRWLKGCYIEADAILDRTRILRKTLQG